MTFSKSFQLVLSSMMSLIYKISLIISLIHLSNNQQYMPKNFKRGRGGRVTFLKKCPCENEPKSHVQNYNHKVNMVNPTSDQYENTGKMLKINVNVVYPLYVAKGNTGMNFAKQITVPIVVYPSTNSPVSNMPQTLINLEVRHQVQDIKNVMPQPYKMDTMQNYNKFDASKQPYSQLSASNQSQISTENVNNCISFEL